MSTRPKQLKSLFKKIHNFGKKNISYFSVYIPLFTNKINGYTSAMNQIQKNTKKGRSKRYPTHLIRNPKKKKTIDFISQNPFEIFSITNKKTQVTDLS